MSAVEIAASLTMRADVADDMVVTWQLQTGWTAQQILVAHYDGLLRRRVGSEGDRASWREAREFVAEPKFMEFIKDVVNTTGAKLIDLVKLFKDSRVVKFFGKVGWSFKAIFALLKDGLKAYQTLQKAIGEYVANTRVGRWTTEELKKLDEWLKSHPRTKKLAGVAVGALLIYFWFNQSFIGDPAFDFDMSYILDALAGKFDLASLFGGPSGMALLLAIAIGFATGASFPWPGPGTVKFVGAIIGTIAMRLGKKVRGLKASLIRRRVKLSSSFENTLARELVRIAGLLMVAGEDEEGADL